MFAPLTRLTRYRAFIMVRPLLIASISLLAAVVQACPLPQSADVQERNDECTQEQPLSDDTQSMEVETIVSLPLVDESSQAVTIDLTGEQPQQESTINKRPTPPLPGVHIPCPAVDTSTQLFPPPGLSSVQITRLPCPSTLGQQRQKIHHRSRRLHYRVSSSSDRCCCCTS